MSAGTISTVDLPGVGHYVAQQAPEQLAAELLPFLAAVDADREPASR